MIAVVWGVPDWLDHLTVYGGVGIAVAAGMLVFLFLILPQGKKALLRMPFALLAIHLAIVLLRAIAVEDAQTGLSIAGVFFLLVSMARSGYLLLLQIVVTPTFGGDVPKILRDVLQALLFLGACLLTLRAAGVELSALLTTSALLTAVIGFALQDTLGNLFAGLAIQAQRPFRVGEWIQFDDDESHVAEVIEINWRAVRMRTLDCFEMTVPNSTLAKSSLRNFSEPTRAVRRHAYVFAPYDQPPERIIAELIEALKDVDGVLDSPKTSVIVDSFGERGVRYDVRYFIAEFEERENVAGAVRERLWYSLQRMGVQIPVPQRLVRLYDLSEERLEHEEAARVDAKDRELQSVDFLRALPDDARHRLAENTHRRLYAPGEPIIEEGEHGAELFIIRRGEVAVEIGRHKRCVARLGPGQFFGEMSLMTGAQRRASVRAMKETEVLVIDKAALKPVLDGQPELAETISSVLALREAELMRSSSAGGLAAAEAEAEDLDLLDRIKSFFSLSSRRTLSPEELAGVRRRGAAAKAPKSRWGSEQTSAQGSSTSKGSKPSKKDKS